MEPDVPIARLSLTYRYFIQEAADRQMPLHGRAQCKLLALLARQLFGSGYTFADIGLRRLKPSAGAALMSGCGGLPDADVKSQKRPSHRSRHSARTRLRGRSATEMKADIALGGDKN